jgi:MOSC domain-containing protein YiiM
MAEERSPFRAHPNCESNALVSKSNEQSGAHMKVLSVNVGTPRQYNWMGQPVTTSIFKSPVEGEVAVLKLDLAGDEQADLTVHGGVDKAVYAYPHEHYAYWIERGIKPLKLGNFGENLTIEGLLESGIHIGDELEIGSARFVVTQPRMPCYKLQVRFNRPEMTKVFYRSRRFGFYLKVLREGALQADAPITIVQRDPNAVSVADLIAIYTGETNDRDLFQRAIAVEALPEAWREELQQRAAHHQKSSVTG